MQVYPTARQTVDLRTQTLVTTDEKVVGVGGMVAYRVVDIEALLGRTFDADQTIKDICAGAISEVVRGASWPDLQTVAFERELRYIMRRRLRPFGVFVIKATLTDCSPIRVIKIVNAASADLG
jgi:regulator of protease activity HflC (stomatin/prohibitin superfamily)